LPSYDVIMYPIVIVKVNGVEAPDMEAAIKKAEASVDLNLLLSNSNPGSGVKYIGFADDFDGFMVDVAGDSDYSQTHLFDKFGKQLPPVPGIKASRKEILHG
jgi:hypothetical protein